MEISCLTQGSLPFPLKCWRGDAGKGNENGEEDMNKRPFQKKKSLKNGEH